MMVMKKVEGIGIGGIRMEWLAGLGEIEANFEKITLIVPMQNKKGHIEG